MCMVVHLRVRVCLLSRQCVCVRACAHANVCVRVRVCGFEGNTLVFDSLQASHNATPNVYGVEDAAAIEVGSPAIASIHTLIVIISTLIVIIGLLRAIIKYH